MAGHCADFGHAPGSSIHERMDATTVDSKQVFETEILQFRQFHRFKPGEMKKNTRGKTKLLLAQSGGVSSLNCTESPGEGGGASC